MNKFIAKGRLTQDPQIKTIESSDTKVANFGIAVRRTYKNKNDEYETDFFNCSAFGGVVNFVENYIKKGQEVLITAHLQNNQWETDSGEKRISTNVIVENIEFCGNKVQQEEEKSDMSAELEVADKPEQDEPLPF